MLERLLVSSLFNIAALWAAAELLDGVDYGGRWQVLVAAGVVFAVVNLLLRAVLTVLLLPVIVLTLGLALLLVNVMLLYLTSALVDDFQVSGFGSAVAAALIVWAVNALLAMAFGKPGERRLWR